MVNLLKNIIDLVDSRTSLYLPKTQVIDEKKWVCLPVYDDCDFLIFKNSDEVDKLIETIRKTNTNLLVFNLGSSLEDVSLNVFSLSSEKKLAYFKETVMGFRLPIFKNNIVYDGYIITNEKVDFLIIRSNHAEYTVVCGTKEFIDNYFSLDGDNIYEFLLSHKNKCRSILSNNDDNLSWYNKAWRLCGCELQD